MEPPPLTNVGGRAFQEAVGKMCVGIETLGWADQKALSSAFWRRGKRNGRETLFGQSASTGLFIHRIASKRGGAI